MFDDMDVSEINGDIIDYLKSMNSDDEIIEKVTPEQFSNFIEGEYSKHNGAATYVEIISGIIEEVRMDYSKATKLLTAVLFEKIKKESIKLNLLRNVIKSYDLLDGD